MLRSLVIRQVFVVLDLALAVLVAIVAYLVIAKLTETDTARSRSGPASNGVTRLDANFAAVGGLE